MCKYEFIQLNLLNISTFILTLHLFLLVPANHYFFFFFNDTATTEIYTLSLHDALPIAGEAASGRSPGRLLDAAIAHCVVRSEEHTSELQSREKLVCRLLLEKKKKITARSGCTTINSTMARILSNESTSPLFIFTVLIGGTLSGFCFFFFNDTATTEIYTLSLHDALPIYRTARMPRWSGDRPGGMPSGR